MQATWYCRIGDRQYGPISVAQLQRLAARGDLTPTCLVRRSDETTWYEASRVGGLWARATPLPPTGVPASGPPVATDSPSSGMMNSLPMEIVPIPPSDVMGGEPSGSREASAVIPVAGGQETGAESRSGVVTRPGGAGIGGHASSAAAARPVNRRPAAARPAAQSRPPAPPVQTAPPVAQGAPGMAGAPGIQVRPVGPIPMGVAVSSAVGGGQIHVPGTPSGPPMGPAGSAGIEASGQVAGETLQFGVRTAKSGGKAGRKSAASKSATSSTSSDGAELSKAELRRLEAKKRLYLLFGGAGGVLALVAAIAVVVAMRGDGSTSAGTKGGAADTNAVAANSSGTTPTSAVADKATDAATGTTAATGGSEAAASKSSTGASPSASTDASKGKSSGADAATVEKVLKSIAPWRDASSIAGVSTKTSRLQITGAWLSGKENKVVCVEVQVSCLPQGQTPMNYNSWNLTGGSGASPSVLLTDAAGKPLPLISVEKWSDPARQTAAVRLAPGQSVGDLLAFEAPAGEYEHLQLVLKLTALGQGERYLGFRLPKDMIAPERPRDVVAAGGQRPPMRRAGGEAAGGEEEMKNEPAVAADKTAADKSKEGDAATTKEAVKDLAKAMAKDGEGAEAKPAASKPAGEETILDLRKQIEESVKASKAEKAKQRDQEKPKEN